MKCVMSGCVNLAVYISGGSSTLCPRHRDEFNASPEGKRLAAISVSLLAEWQERERCEKLNAGSAEPVVTPTTSEDS